MALLSLHGSRHAEVPEIYFIDRSSNYTRIPEESFSEKTVKMAFTSGLKNIPYGITESK